MVEGREACTKERGGWRGRFGNMWLARVTQKSCCCGMNGRELKTRVRANTHIYMLDTNLCIHYVAVHLLLIAYYTNC